MRDELTPGRNVGATVPAHELEPGDYGQEAGTGIWRGRTPNGLLCNLAAHQVEVHPDDTISVTPSIEAIKGDPDAPEGPPLERWHGFLEHGVWREA